MTAAARLRALPVPALLASLAVHAAVAIFIPALAWTASTDPSVETISFVHVPRIQLEVRRPQPQPRAIAPQKSRSIKINEATKVELAHTQSRKASPPPAVSRRESTAPTVASAMRAGEVAGSGTAAPAPTSTPAPAKVAESGRQTGGYMPFGAEQPDPVLDPAVRKQLDALNVHVTLIVTVGEDGRTKNIAFTPAVDSQVQARIAQLLADAAWDPAVCGGGISCEGRATIKL